MPIHKYFLSDFVELQRKSFYKLLEKGLIEEFSKRNPITDKKKTMELFFYPEYYKLNLPKYSPSEAILKAKSYSSKLYIPVQLTDKKSKVMKLKWVYIGNLPLMTKRGHFILNGAARVVVNQILRSPGIYFQQKTYEQYNSKWNQKPDKTYKRYYADLISERGYWLRIEIDRQKRIWIQLKKIRKIPVLWFLLGMGLTEKTIFKSIASPQRLLATWTNIDPKKIQDETAVVLNYAKNTREAWSEIYSHLFPGKEKNVQGTLHEPVLNNSIYSSNSKDKNYYGVDHFSSANLNYFQPYKSISQKIEINTNLKNIETTTEKFTNYEFENKSELGRKLLFNAFMNPRKYDLGKQGRLSFNKKLGLSISLNQTTLTAQDILFATDYLLQIEKGLKKIDDIDHLKNRRVRTSGELIQIQIGTGLLRLEKSIRLKMNKIASSYALKKVRGSRKSIESSNYYTVGQIQEVDIKNPYSNRPIKLEKVSINNVMNTKPFNGALREFFGTSPLSQFMDQINPLAELTHKRRLSSMGPGGVTRDNATLAIRGIHPTHYGRICPVETPEGKNTGLVNSLTIYARVNTQGLIETPFYKVYKGQVQKKAGMFFFSAEQEEKIKLAAADLFTSQIGFLPKANIPVRIAEDFTKIPRNSVEYIGVAPIQMISIATSLIPFLEHDDANRALMGSNMQRQAVPLIRPERPIVGTGLEARAVSDSGHVIQAKASGFVKYVSAEKIIVYTVL